MTDTPRVPESSSAVALVWALGALALAIAAIILAVIV